VAALVGQVADGGSADASSESKKEERSVRLNDLAAVEGCGIHVVFIVNTAVLGAFRRLATTAQEITRSRSVRVRVATVGAGKLDCVGLVALLAAALLKMVKISWTYNAACKEENGSQAVSHRHDESWDGRDPNGGDAYEADEQGEAASERRVGSCRRHRIKHLPFRGADGEAEDDGGEEELERAGDEGGEHVVRVSEGWLGVVVCRIERGWPSERFGVASCCWKNRGE
jgi:hypothetical protein